MTTVNITKHKNIQNLKRSASPSTVVSRKSSRDDSSLVSRAGKKKNPALHAVRKTVRGALGIKKKSHSGSLNKANKKSAKSTPGATKKQEQAAPIPGSSLVPEQAAGSVKSDDETVYNVEVYDHKSNGGPSTPATMSSSSATAANSMDSTINSATPIVDSNGDMLQVVLLLLDPTSRRFELLQMEFDKQRAIVADVLAQVPISSAEVAFRQQEYAGICTREGTDMMNTVHLSEFCSTNEVVVAVPKGMTSQNVAKFSRPILNDPKVVTMLQSNAERATPPLEEESKTEPPPIHNRAVPELVATKTAPMAIKSPTKKSTSTLSLVVAFIALVAVYAVYAIFQNHRAMAAPLGPGDVLAPGEYRSRCGIVSRIPLLKSYCEDATLKMGDEGVLTLTNDQEEVVWQMEGNVCAKDNEECVSGAIVTPDGSINIGDGPVAAVFGDLNMDAITPWPFTTKPWKAYWAPKTRSKKEEEEAGESVDEMVTATTTETS